MNFLLQVLWVRLSWVTQVLKEMMVNQDPRGSADHQDSPERWDPRVCATTAEAATEPPSKQVSYQEGFINSGLVISDVMIQLMSSVRYVQWLGK